jgi:hypothetical protein
MANMQDWVKYSQAQGTPGAFGAWQGLLNSFGGDQNQANNFINWGQQKGGYRYMPTTTTPSASQVQSMTSGLAPGTQVLGGPGFSPQVLQALNGNTGVNVPGTPGNMSTNGSWNVNGQYNAGTAGTTGSAGLGPDQAVTNTPTVPNLQFSPYVNQAVQQQQAPINNVGPGGIRPVTQTGQGKPNPALGAPPGAPAPANPAVPSTNTPITPPADPGRSANIARPKSGYSFIPPGWNGGGIQWGR